jgi:hypothetical protein
MGGKFFIKILKMFKLNRKFCDVDMKIIPFAY